MYNPKITLKFKSTNVLTTVLRKKEASSENILYISAFSTIRNKRTSEINQMKTTKKIRRCFFRKQYFIIIALSGCLLQVCLGQETLTGLYRNEAIEKAYKQLPKYQHKSNTFIHYEPISLPFIDDFSNYTGYPDTALWIGRQAFVNQSFAVNPPTIG
ncbi:MAG: hypothetical protein LBQ64_01350, partial [Bacteroidales bacterium]|nr:hypothetical protein [Bacteroidales bacterium]